MKRAHHPSEPTPENPLHRPHWEHTHTHTHTRPAFWGPLLLLLTSATSHLRPHHCLARDWPSAPWLSSGWSIQGGGREGTPGSKREETMELHDIVCIDLQSTEERGCYTQTSGENIYLSIVHVIYFVFGSNCDFNCTYINRNAGNIPPESVCFISSLLFLYPTIQRPSQWEQNPQPG